MTSAKTPTAPAPLRPGEVVLVHVNPDVHGVDELPAVVTTVDDDGSATATVFRPVGHPYAIGGVRVYSDADERDALVAEHTKLLPPREKGAAPYGLVDILPWVAPAHRTAG